MKERENRKNKVATGLCYMQSRKRKRFGMVKVKEKFLFVSYYYYFELVYLVTALVPSETACLASSPGKIKRTAV